VDWAGDTLPSTALRAGPSTALRAGLRHEGTGPEGPALLLVPGAEHDDGLACRVSEPLRYLALSERRDTGGLCMAARIQINNDKVAEFCRRHHIRKLAFFGSVVRQDFRPDSDVDVLVEFEPGHVPGLAFIAMQDELSQLLGRRADLNTIGFLSPYFRDDVLREAEVLYGQT
jgi:hypothetical protein